MSLNLVILARQVALHLRIQIPGASKLLCQLKNSSRFMVPVEPVLTTAAACGTAVESSLGSARLLQWSKTQAYASNVYCTNLSQAV